MKAIISKYLGPTDYRGSRIRATAEGGHSVTVGYDCGSSDPHREAVKALLIKTGWKGNMVSGGMPDGRLCWLFVKSLGTLENPNGDW